MKLLHYVVWFFTARLAGFKPRFVSCWKTYGMGA